MPSVVIEDPQGLVVNLTWTTKSGNALEKGDLDLAIWYDYSTYDQSSNRDTFEQVTIDNDTFEDGVYFVRIVLFQNTMDLNYTIEVSGASVEESLIADGVISDYYPDHQVEKYFKIRKAGDAYTVTRLK